MSEEEKEEQLPEVDYLLVATYKIGDDILAKAKKARYIQKTGIGVDNIDANSAKAHRLPIANTPGGNATGVAELTTIIYYDKFRASKEHEEQLGASYLSLEDVLMQSDIISPHIPLIEETKGLICEKELRLMKKSAVIVNVSRGGTIQEKALYEALKNGIIAGATVDAWESEPTNPDNPLLKLDNVIASPHIGAGTRDILNRVLDIAFTNIKNVDDGQTPKFVVNDINQPRV
jgi:phosphoglycerate dehydrogenase-like enzyme